MNGKVTTKDVYELVDKKIDALEKKVIHRIERVEDKAVKNKSSVSKLTGSVNTSFIIISVTISVAGGIVVWAITR